jgi:hypothetical protein
MKDGTEREMEKKAYDLLGYKRKPQIVGEVAPKIDKNDAVAVAKAELIRKKAAGEPLVLDAPKLSELPQTTVITDEVVMTEKPKAKPGPKPKSKE